jgi:hypothetical protein
MLTSPCTLTNKCNNLGTYSRIPLIRFTMDQTVAKSSDTSDYATGPYWHTFTQSNCFATAPILGLQDEWQHSSLAVAIRWQGNKRVLLCVLWSVHGWSFDGVDTGNWEIAHNSWCTDTLGGLFWTRPWSLPVSLMLFSCKNENFLSWHHKHPVSDWWDIQITGCQIKGILPY